MTLNIFQKLKKLDDDQLHNKFKLLLDFSLKGERDILTSWTEGFVDRDNKIVEEFQRNFHSAFWEFYLHAVFKEAGLEIDFSKDRPDFVITSPYKINVEAVVANIKQGGREEADRDLNDILGALTPPSQKENFSQIVDEAVARHSGSILSKFSKYEESYSKLNWVNQDAPYVIALGSFDQVNYGQEYYYPMLKLLYGLDFNPLSEMYRNVTEIRKPGTDSTLSVSLFNDPKYENISAVLFSCVTTLGKLTSLAIPKNELTAYMQNVAVLREDFEPPYYKMQIVDADNQEELSDGLFVFHNHHAKNKLPLEVFQKTNAFQFYLNEEGQLWHTNSSPIVARINLNRILTPDSIFECLLYETICKFN